MVAEGSLGIERQLLYSGSQFMESWMLCADAAVSSIWLGHVSSSSMGVASRRCEGWVEFLRPPCVFRLWSG